VLDGQDLGSDNGQVILELTQTEQDFVFSDISAEPVPSLLRGFSAPVVLDYNYQESDLVFLAKHETDPFNRWEAIQRLAIGVTIAVLNGANLANQSKALIDTIDSVLSAQDLDPAYQALVLSFPGEGYISEQLNQVDPVAVRNTRNAIIKHVSVELAHSFEQAFERFDISRPYQSDPAQAGQRAMKNLALTHLVTAGLSKFEQIASDQGPVCAGLQRRSAGHR